MTEWRPVPGFESVYEVADSGDVRRVGGGRGARIGRILKHHPINSGYQFVTLWSDNRQHARLVHRLVAEAFIGPAPTGFEVNHKDLDKGNNHAVNLEYMTRSDNARHRAAAGIGRGESNGAARLTEAIVIAIRSRNAAGVGYKRLAREYGVRPESVRDIVKRRNWGWLAQPDS